MKPPIVGPSAGATEMTMEILPIVRPRDSGGTRFMTVVMSKGIMMAVPHAWTMRPNNSTSKPGAVPESSVPALNRVMARINTGRVLRRCNRYPVIGMTTAMVSMKAEVSHWAAPAVISRSFIRCGMATLMMVSLRITTNADTSKSAITKRLRAEVSLSLNVESGADALFISVGDMVITLWVWRSDQGGRSKIGPC